MRGIAHWLVLLAGLLAFAAAAEAQGLFANTDDHVEVSAALLAPTADEPARLRITAKLDEDWHTYAIDQPKGGPLPTKIQVEDSASAQVVGPFTASPKADVHAAEGYDVPVHEHAGQVTWTAPVELTDGNTGELSGSVKMQLCSGTTCLPPKTKKFTATLGSPTAVGPPPFEAESVGAYKPTLAHAAVRGSIRPATVPPGGTATLSLTVTPEDGYHIYKLEPSAPDPKRSPTLIAATYRGELSAGAASTDAPVEKKPSPEEDEPPYEQYVGPVTFKVPLTVPADAQGEQAFQGILGFQVCSDTSCDPQQGVAFAGTVRIGAAAGGETPLKFAKSKYKLAKAAAESEETAQAALEAERQAAELAAKEQAAAAAALDDLEWELTELNSGSLTFPLMIVFGFIGGFLLNFMPCVLPVIGLKVLSFAQQAGQDRLRVLVLNLVFSLGLLSVLWVLAAAAIFLGFGWGQQFQQAWFTISLAGLVFAMGLSFLGVWEIELPSFLSEGDVDGESEGLAGAFFKGVMTTVLATPCSGPFLGSIFGAVLILPGWMVLAIFTSIGLGMASPYLVVGVFPSLVGFLPKPGAWMDTFKQSLSFLLFGTVVFLLASVPLETIPATLLILAAIGFTCWLVGRLEYGVPFREALSKAWLPGLATVVIAVAIAGTPEFGPGLWLSQLGAGIPEGLVIPALSLVVGLALAVWIMLHLTSEAFVTRYWFAGFLLAAGGLLLGLSVSGLLPLPIEFQWLGFACVILGALAWAANWVASHQAIDGRSATWASAAAYALVAVAVMGSQLEAVENYLQPNKSKLAFGKYSIAELKELQRDGKTVLVDFTADWCLTCQVNKKTAINTRTVYEKVEEYGVVPLKADWTNQEDAHEVTVTLRKLRSNSIPLLALFPANEPDKVYLLRDAVVESQVLDAIETAGPSKPTTMARR